MKPMKAHPDRNRGSRLGAARTYAAEYFRETGAHVLMVENGRAVACEYVAWLETKLTESIRREAILQGVRSRP